MLDILKEGVIIKSRNGNALTAYNKTVKFDMSNNRFPILNVRKIFYKGVIGELRSFIDGCKTNECFIKNGCNFWTIFKETDGSLNLDYVEKLNGNNQLRDVINNMKTDPHSRRHVIDLWSHENVQGNKLSLPCCHYSYIFNIDADKKIHMTWVQRSLDCVIGAPSDFILAGLLMQAIATETRYKMGTVTMLFANAHLYEEHIEDVHKMLKRKVLEPQPKFKRAPQYTKIENEASLNIELIDYNPNEPMKFLLKA